MANVTIETKVWTDARFKILAAKIKKSRFDAIGRVAALWEYCTEHEKYSLSSAEIDAVCEIKNFGPALASSDVNLATQSGNDFYINGTKNRIEWLRNLRKGRKSGGLSRAKNASRKLNGRFKRKRKKHPAGAASTYLDSAGPADPAPSSVLTLITTSLSAAPLGGDRAPLNSPLPPSDIKSLTGNPQSFEEKKAAAQRLGAKLLEEEKLKSARSDGLPTGATDSLKNAGG